MLTYRPHRRLRRGYGDQGRRRHCGQWSPRQWRGNMTSGTSGTRIGEQAHLAKWSGGRSTMSGSDERCADEGALDVRDTAAASAAVERAAGALCARWKPTILLLLASGARRRSELDRCLPVAVSQKVLTEQLRGLESDGLVARVDHRALRHAGRRHVTYALTPAGEQLSDVVRALARWGTAHSVGGSRRPGERSGVRGEQPVRRPPLDVADRRTG